MRLRVAVAAAVAVAAHERQRVAGPSSTMSSRSLPMRSFGPGQVLQDRDGAAGAARRLAHALGDLGVLLGAAVGEVQPRDVHPRLDHPHEDLGVAGGRADGGDDLGPAHRACRQPMSTYCGSVKRAEQPRVARAEAHEGAEAEGRDLARLGATQRDRRPGQIVFGAVLLVAEHGRKTEPLRESTPCCRRRESPVPCSSRLLCLPGTGRTLVGEDGDCYRPGAPAAAGGSCAALDVGVSKTVLASKTAFEPRRSRQRATGGEPVRVRHRQLDFGFLCAL